MIARLTIEQKLQGLILVIICCVALLNYFI